MPIVPPSLIEFQRSFPDDETCAAWLFEVRWPGGFRCPRCAHDKAWSLETKRHTYEYTRCHRQTSVTAGTILHRSKLPLLVWFWAAFLMATHSNGISALQLQKQLGIRSYKTAWLLAAKLRRAMVNPERYPLQGLVEIDETTMACRTINEPVDGGQGRSHRGKLLIVGAVEVNSMGHAGRIRLTQIDDFSGQSLKDFVAENVTKDSVAKTDGWSGYQGLDGVTHDAHTVGPVAAHIILPSVHRLFSNLKSWALGVYHGLRRKHLQSYLDEFTFRFNRRRYRTSAFKAIFNIATKTNPVTYNMLI